MSGLVWFTVCGLLVCSLAQIHGQKFGQDLGWDMWKTYYGRYYPEDQLNQRYANWLTTREYVLQHNQAASTYTQTLNKFADFSGDELDLYISRLGYIYSPDSETTFLPRLEDMMKLGRGGMTIVIPSSVNWVEEGAVTAVKDQGSCGSCYAFAAMSALESAQYIMAGNNLTRLSEQNIIDCSFDNGNMGCAGGNMPNVYRYVLENDGVDTDASYPYTSGESGVVNDECQFNPDYVGATLIRHMSIPSGDENTLKISVANIGPVSCAVHVRPAFMRYSDGVYSSDECESTTSDVNHAVVIVGYGTTDDGIDYWLMLNSWGTTWGDDGYMKILRGQNMCGIATACSLPIVA